MAKYIKHNVTHNQYESLCCKISYLHKCMKTFIDYTCVPLLGDEISHYTDNKFARFRQSFLQCSDKFNSISSCAVNLDQQITQVIDNIAHQDQVPKQNESFYLLILDILANIS